MPRMEHLTPRNPVLDWSSFGVSDAGWVVSIEDIPHKAFTTSGRAAIYHGLKHLASPSGSVVLVPTYHCPTMVAPVLLAGLEVAFFALRPDGLPKVEAIPEAIARKCKAMIVPHYFGLPQSLQEARSWCDANGIALIEDCAHCYFGMAGSRPIGTWGDYSTASLSKFFPVPEAGLLASFERAIPALRLTSPSWKSQCKGVVDVFERSALHKRFAGINSALRALFRIKNYFRNQREPNLPHRLLEETPQDSAIHDCDMSRIDQAPLLASMVIKSALPRGRIISRRQKNFALYASLLSNLNGARPLFGVPPTAVAPYVFPLWVDDAERVYEALKNEGVPVFRWDRLWPGVPIITGDVGPLWSHHVLQLLCHQDLTEEDVLHSVDAVKRALARAQRIPSEVAVAAS